MLWRLGDSCLSGSSSLLVFFSIPSVATIVRCGAPLSPLASLLRSQINSRQKDHNWISQNSSKIHHDQRRNCSNTVGGGIVYYSGILASESWCSISKVNGDPEHHPIVMEDGWTSSRGKKKICHVEIYNVLLLKTRVAVGVSFLSSHCLWRMLISLSLSLSLSVGDCKNIGTLILLNDPLDNPSVPFSPVHPSK